MYKKKSPVAGDGFAFYLKMQLQKMCTFSPSLMIGLKGGGLIIVLAVRGSTYDDTNAEYDICPYEIRASTLQAQNGQR